TLIPEARSWLVNVAAFSLSAQGRLAEAIPAQRRALRRAEVAKNWSNAATSGANLSQAQLVLGEIAASLATAQQAIAHADRSGHEFQMLFTRAGYADVLHAAGRLAEAEAQFVDAERRQKEWQPQQPLLYSLRGYQYCDLLISNGNYRAARDR